MRSVAEMIELFRERGFRITPQRRLIFTLLAADNSHPTAEELYQRATAIIPEISRTTVYNTVSELVSLGELTPVESLSENGLRYDTNTTPHHHLYCMRCHALVDVGRAFEGVTLSEEDASGYKIVRSQVTFYGYCPQCLAEMERATHADPSTDTGEQ